MEDIGEMIGEYQEGKRKEEIEEKLKGRQAHSVLESGKVMGEPLYPHEIIRDTILTLYTVAIMFFLASFVPPPLHHAADPTAPTAYPPPLPDWYLLWAFGCLKVAWDIEMFGVTLMTAKVWGTLSQGLIVGIVVMWPFVDRAIAAIADPGKGNVVMQGHARRPGEDPIRAAAGVYGLVLILLLSVFSVNTNITAFYEELDGKCQDDGTQWYCTTTTESSEVWVPELTTDMLNQLTLWLPLILAGMTHIWLDRRRAEGAKPLSDEERFDLYRNGINTRKMQRVYEFKLNRCYQCGLCDDICPVRDVEGEEELNIIFNTFQNEHDGVAMWSCITCGMCTGVCPQNIEYVDYVLEQRIMSTEGTS